MHTPLTRNFILVQLLLLVCTVYLQAQTENITVVGTMTDNQGYPIPSLTVMIDGTERGTITDVDGNYTIKAPLGSTLVFSFVGMKTQRALVTRTGLNPEGTRKIIPYNYGGEDTRFTRLQDVQSKKDSIDYAKRMEQYRKYVADSLILQRYQRTSVSASDVNNSRAKRQIQRYTDPYGDRAFLMGDVVVESSFSILKAGRLPELQSTFAQGRPLNGEYTYQGPETGELFSWGPALANLEFDGIPTSNDQNGSLVLRGTGNGIRAKAYDPSAMFRTGFMMSTGVTSYQTIFGAKTNVSYQNQRSNGIMPNEEILQHSLRLNLNLDERLNVSVNYNNTEELFKNGLMQSRMLAAAYLTPVTFDNANGLTRKKALEQSRSIYHPDGSLRSASPGQLDNPYFLVQEANNDSKIEALTYNGGYKANWNTGSVNFDVSGELYRNQRHLLFPVGTVGMTGGRSSMREEKLNNYFFSALVSNQLYRERLVLKVPLRTELYDYKRTLNLDGFNQAAVNRERRLLTANPYLQYSAYHDVFLLKAGANLYASSTSNKTYLWPNFGAYLKPFDLLDDIFIWDTQNVMQVFKLKYDFSKQANEYSLHTQSGLSNSLFYEVGDFFSYFEDEEIGLTPNIKPEVITRHDFSMEASFIYGRLISETSFFNTNRENSIFSVVEGQDIVFTNAGKIQTHGWEQTISARMIENRFRWNAKLSLAQTKSEVKDLSVTGPLAIAGFKDVNTSLIEGQTPGVIRGNTYQRNANGKMIIGDDGFPLVSNTLSVIGDPNPDCLIGLTNDFSCKGLYWGFTIDGVIGGDVWNGTQSTIDYYGMSQSTAEHRHISDYIFEGVRLDGSVNNQLVDFAPKSGSVQDNRWVRYGPGGVAEGYIEDASRLVLKELYVTYNFPSKVLNSLGLEKLSISLIANNLVTISGYNGNLGSNTLWSHSNTLGLDYFNSPQIRRYSASLKITL